MAAKTSKVCCPSHPDEELIEDHRAGDLICARCGLVVGDRVIDVGSEWRTFSNKDEGDKDRSRVGGVENPLFSGGGLSTIIGGPSGAASYDADGNFKYRRNRTQQSTDDRNITQAIQDIDGMAQRISLPSTIVSQAAELYKKVRDSKKLPGKSTEALSAACLYIACRKEQVPRTFREICAVSQVSKKEIGRSFKLIVQILEEDLKVVDASHLLNRFCANLEEPPKVLSAALHICKATKDNYLVAGRSHVTIAAAAIYMASWALGKRHQPSEIGEVAGVAEATIKPTYKQMLPRARELFPPDCDWNEIQARLPKG